MLLQAAPTRRVAVTPSSDKLCCCCSENSNNTHNLHTEEVSTRNSNATCATCHQCRRVKNNVCGILLGAMPEPASLRHLRRWQACCRPRRKRRKGGGEIKNAHNNKNNSNNNTRATCNKQARVARTARSRVEKRKLRKRVISTHATSYNCSAAAVASLLLADYNGSGMLQARNSNCLRARITKTTEVAAAARVAMDSGAAPKALLRLLDARTATTIITTTSTVTRPLSKLVKCERPLKKPKLVAVMATEQQQTPPAFSPEQQQQQQDEELSVSTCEAVPQVDGLRIYASVPLEQQLITRDAFQYKQQQQQQQPKYCLQISSATAAATVQRPAAKVNDLQHRSWRNLIGCAATTTRTTTCNVINTNTNHIATAPTAATTSAYNYNASSVSVVATKMSTTTASATLSASQQDVVQATANRVCVETTNRNISAPSRVAPCVIVRKSKCRSTVALTSALTALVNTTAAAAVATTPTAKAIQPVKSTKRDKPTQIKLARSKTTTTSATTTTLFGNIFTLLVGLLTLHATVLRCLLFTALTAATATVTAAPFVAQNSLLLLSQQRMEQHSQHNNNSNNTSSDSTFPPSSAHNYNHRHTTQPPPPPPILNRMMDIEVLNGSSYTDTLKSLSSTLVEAAEAEQGDVNQLPIFDFGLPRNITARTGQAEAAIKCRVERLDDKSVSWIRKRDLHILTVATATYTSDKRFQVTSSKDGREWTLHVKSPQARDTGIYECQVNTEPKMSMAFQLNIIEIPADSRAIISGPADLHFKVGSAIILSCHVQQPSIRDIGPIYWYRGEHIITPFELHEDEESDSANNNNQHSLHSGGMATPALLNNELAADVTATITNANALTAAGGGGGGRGGSGSSMGAAMAVTAPHDGLSNDITPDFTARIAMESQLGDTMKSRLRISNAQTTDTGNYTCQPTTASSASVMVHVINDENPAAMQKSSASSMRMRTTTKLATLLLLAAITTTTIIETLMTRANIIMRATKATMAIIVAATTTTTTTTLLLTYLCGVCPSQQQQQQQQEFMLQEAQQVNWTLLKQQQQQQQQLQL